MEKRLPARGRSQGSTLFVTSDAAKARVQLDTAVQKDAGDAWPLMGQLVLADRQTRADRVVGIALDLIERQPEHPLATLAARTA